VYSFGVMAFEMMAGELPFKGPTAADFRQQHLHEDPPSLEGVSPRLSALVDECIYKAPGARPAPANLAQRLERVESDIPAARGISRLQEANRQEISRRAETSRQESQARSVEEQRQELFGVASRAFDRIGTALKEALADAAPSVSLRAEGSGWAFSLGQAKLRLSAPGRTAADPWQWDRPAVDVIAHAELNLRIPRDRYEYEGRSHSLWFCDAQTAGDYDWYETAFMISPFIAQRGRQNPFALDPGEAAAKALRSGMAEYQLAWPFTRLVVDDLADFFDRWAGWFADAAEGRLTHPSTMPERPTQGSWRR
jgi:serine/threonine-protein kinase